MVSMVLILFHIHNTNLNELVRKKNLVITLKKKGIIYNFSKN